MKHLLPVLFVILLPVFALAQTDSSQPDPREYVMHIAKTTVPLKLDGLFDEPIWETATIAKDFQCASPVDTGQATAKTAVRFAFDDRNLYVAITCWQPRADYTIQSLKRDFGPGTSDVINILLDPSKDGLNGFAFCVSPLNVQREALIDNGANLSYEWDNKWFSAVQNYADRWTVEMAIPFKTLRYSVAPGENSWHTNFVRTTLKPWEVSAWKPVPQQYATNNLAFTGTLIWDTPPPKPGANVAIIPYATTGYSVDYRRSPALDITNRPDKWTGNIGGDAKIAVSSSLNLDLTINPDFSQVEVDRQVANLSRFELFFPERRQFFLENRDLFATFGFPDTRPFFSRRIGLAYNPITGNNQTVPIIAGARLSGKLNDNWRVGLLNMQTDRVLWDSANAQPGANFTVATVQRKVFSRSAISAILVNKENFLGKLNEPQRQGWDSWNRMAGLEYNLYSQDNRWEGEWYYHHSFSPDAKQSGNTFGSFLSYNDRHFNARFGHVLIDSAYTAEAGFVPRNGVQNMYPGIGWTFYPQHPYFNTIGIGLNGDLTYALDWQELDRDISLDLDITTKSQAGYSFSVFNNYTYLFEDFDPTNLDEPGTLPLPGLRGYTYSGVSADYYSGNSYNIQGSVSGTAMEFFNGKLYNFESELSYRWQPIGTFALACSYNKITLPKPYASADLWLIGPRAELSFTRNLFASAFFQYNTQANNFNINARLQWRFAPVSDVYFVYTDNSFAQQIPNSPVRFFSPKNKAVVLKVVYWLNV